MKKQEKQKKLLFSGHESFQCRHLWLKKGFDYVKKGYNFSDEESVVHLGVGKNMVSSIRYWMKSFGLLTHDDTLTEIAKKLLSKSGWDPYLEDEGSLWLLHYLLVKNNYASTYSIIFNELRREKVEFTRNNFVNIIKRKVDSIKANNLSEKTISEDFSVFSKMYQRPAKSVKDKEDSFSGLLTDLDLLKSFNNEGEEYYVIDTSERNDVPDEIALYVILDSHVFDKSINITAFEQNHNSLGCVFGMNRAGILQKVENLADKYSFITFRDHAGIKELQFKRKPPALSILEKYYAN